MYTAFVYWPFEKEESQSNPAESGQDPVGQKARRAKSIRSVPSAKYYFRWRMAGKLTRRSLDATVLSVAVLRLGDI